MSVADVLATSAADQPEAYLQDDVLLETEDASQLKLPF